MTGLPSPDGAIVPGFLTDKFGGKWTITPDGQVAVNNLIDHRTLNVEEIVYLGGLIYQRNKWNNWYSTPRAQSPWTGPIAAPVFPDQECGKGQVATTLVDLKLAVISLTGKVDALTAKVDATATKLATVATDVATVAGHLNAQRLAALSKIHTDVAAKTDELNAAVAKAEGETGTV